MKIVQSLEEFGLLIKDGETIKNQSKEEKGGFLCLLLGTLAVSLLWSVLADKGVIWRGVGVIATSQKRGTIRAGQIF